MFLKSLQQVFCHNLIEIDNIKKGSYMIKKNVFVSFDYENDRRYKFLLEAWNANPLFDFQFNDLSSSEINSWSISRIKAALTSKINNATHTLVIVGSEANKRHKDYLEIGYKNWLNFEIARSKNNNNKLVAIKLGRLFESPDELLYSGASWAHSFTQDAIIKALSNG